jgi:hypothetical protein
MKRDAERTPVEVVVLEVEYGFDILHKAHRFELRKRDVVVAVEWVAKGRKVEDKTETEDCKKGGVREISCGQTWLSRGQRLEAAAQGRLVIAFEVKQAKVISGN